MKLILTTTTTTLPPESINQKIVRIQEIVGWKVAEM